MARLENILRNNDNHCHRILALTGGIPEEMARQKALRIADLLTDVLAFAEYYFPHYCQCPTAAFQYDLATQLAHDSTYHGIVEWGRGMAKSVWCDIIIPLWLKAKGELWYMLLVGKNNKSARRFLAGLKAELEYNQRYINDFGRQVKAGRWTEEEFITQDDVAFTALGSGQSPRGLRHGAHRPDYIVADDLDYKQLSKNPKRVREQADWILEDLLGTMDTGRARFLLINNRFSKNQILCRLLTTGSFRHNKQNALTEDGTPAWPEKYTTDYYETLRRRIGDIAFQREYMNNPIEEGAVFKLKHIHYRECLALREYDLLLSYMDPSFEANPSSDCKAIVIIGRHGLEYDVLAVFVRQCEFAEALNWWYHYYLSLPQQVVMQCYIERQFLTTYIREQFSRMNTQYGFVFPVKTDTRKKPNKYQRVEQMSALFSNPSVFFNQNETNKPDMQTLISQLLAFENGSRYPDDGPDALEGALWLLQEQKQKTRPIQRVGQRTKRYY